MKIFPPNSNGVVFRSLLFAAPFLAIILFDLVVVGRGFLSLPDPLSFKGLSDMAFFQNFDPLLLSHYPRNFTSVVFFILSAVVDPLDSLDIFGIGVLWLGFVCAYILGASILVGNVTNRYGVSPYVIFLSAAIAATMSAMIRGYMLMFTHYIVGVTLVVCALLAYLALKSDFKDAHLTKWLFLLTGFVAGLHYGSAFLILVVFGAYGFTAFLKRRLLLFEPENHGLIWGWALNFSVALIAVSIFSLLFKVTYGALGKLSLAVAVLGAGAGLFAFAVNRHDFRKVLMYIAVAGVAQGLFFALAKGQQVWLGHASFLSPHVVFSAFPAVLIVLSLRPRMWFQDILKGPVGISAIGVLVSSSYGTPFLLEGVTAANRYLKGAKFGNVSFWSDAEVGVCSLNWDLAASIFSIALFLIVSLHRKLSPPVRTVGVLTLFAVIAYTVTVFPGSCTYRSTGMFFGLGSRVFLVLLFFAPFAVILSTEFGKTGRAISRLCASLVCVAGIYDYLEADASRLTAVNQAQLDAREYVAKELALPETHLVCLSMKALTECSVACQYFQGQSEQVNETFRAVVLGRNQGRGKLVDIGRIHCSEPSKKEFSSGRRYVAISSHPRLEFPAKGWSKIWSSEPYVYIYTNEGQGR